MVTISPFEYGTGLKISDDLTFGEVRINCRDHDEELEVLIRLVKESLKNE